jgi:glutathione S-transferase
MKLHYGNLSSNSRRVRMTAKLLNLPLDEVSVDLRSPADRAKLVEINPNSKVPVLVDGDFVLWESVAIMQYFCDRTPGQTLYPTEPRARGGQPLAIVGAGALEPGGRRDQLGARVEEARDRRRS